MTPDYFGKQPIDIMDLSWLNEYVLYYNTFEENEVPICECCPAGNQKLIILGLKNDSP